MEYIDIYDANMRPRGRMEREEAHRLGEWHRTVHLWLVDRDRAALVFQLRGPGVIANPGKFDATAAGHVLAGEDDLAGLREVREELGIDVPAEVHHLGYRTETTDLAGGYCNREFQSVFMALSPAGTSTFNPDPAEVHGAFAIALPDLFRLFEGSTAAVEAKGHELDGAGVWQAVVRTVQLSDFVPRFPRYYLTVAIMAERLLEGRLPVAIG